MFGICNLAMIPLRFEPSDRSEIVSQILFCEHFEILEQLKQWTFIKMQYDGYEGWIDFKQLQLISDESYLKLSTQEIVLSADLVEYITAQSNALIPIPLASSLSFLSNSKINTSNFKFDGAKASGIKEKSNLINTAFMYLNAPYLWGGKTPFGIDCSGFTQMVYKLNGYKLLRDASQQSAQGEALSFIEESEAGDLAFFDNEEGKITHVGIMLNNSQIIHSSGRVKIDRIDNQGIFSTDLQKYSHKLRIIKRYV